MKPSLEIYSRDIRTKTMVLGLSDKTPLAVRKTAFEPIFEVLKKKGWRLVDAYAGAA